MMEDILMPEIKHYYSAFYKKHKRVKDLSRNGNFSPK